MKATHWFYSQSFAGHTVTVPPPPTAEQVRADILCGVWSRDFCIDHAGNILRAVQEAAADEAITDAQRWELVLNAIAGAAAAYVRKESPPVDVEAATKMRNWPVGRT